MGRRKGALTLPLSIADCDLREYAQSQNRERYRGDAAFVEERTGETRKRKSLSRGASPERLWGTSERASIRLVFLFLGGFLLGCHEVFPPFERFVLPRFSTGHLDARTTQVVV
jgi:hypothetical protein